MTAEAASSDHPPAPPDTSIIDHYEDEVDSGPLNIDRFCAAAAKDPKNLYLFIEKEVIATGKKHRQEVRNLNKVLQEAQVRINTYKDDYVEALEKNRQLANYAEEIEAELSKFKSKGTASPTVVGAKPIAFKGSKFDATPGDVPRFLRHLERDFLLYDSNFPTDSHRVAYAMSGLGDKAERWAAQYDHHDDHVLGNWSRFRASLEDHFGDPDLLSNKRRELLALRQTGDVLDFASEFEALAAQVDWPRAALASTFLNGLRENLARAIRRSDIDINDFRDVKSKAFRLERNSSPVRESRFTRDPRPAYRFFNHQNRAPQEKKPVGTKTLTCYKCNQPGHLSRTCPSSKEQAEIRVLEEATTDEEAKNSYP